MSVYMYARTLACMHTHTHMYVCVYVCMHACMHACMYVCMYVCMCVRAYLLACVRTCVGYVREGMRGRWMVVHILVSGNICNECCLLLFAYSGRISRRP